MQRHHESALSPGHASFSLALPPMSSAHTSMVQLCSGQCPCASKFYLFYKNLYPLFTPSFACTNHPLPSSFPSFLPQLLLSLLSFSKPSLGPKVVGLEVGCPKRPPIGELEISLAIVVVLEFSRCCIIVLLVFLYYFSYVAEFIGRI